MNTPTHTWNYQNADGTTVGYVERFDGPNGKAIVPSFVCDGAGGFTKGALQSNRPLYGLTGALLAGDRPIFITEGEKCAAAIQGLGLVAVCSLGGSNAPHLSDWAPIILHKGPLFLLPDNDEAGEKYGRAVAEILNNPCLRVVRLNDLAIGEDVVDWLQSIYPAWDGYCPLENIAGSDGIDATRTLLLEQCSKGEPYSSPLATMRDSAIEEPLPLMPAMREAEPYPVDALGAYLAPVVEAVQGVVNAPMALCAQSVLAAATLAVQGFADVQLPNGQRRPVSNFYLSLAESGERKTSCDNEALVPIRTREKELTAQREAEMPAYHNKRDAHEQARKLALAEKNKTKRENELFNLGMPPLPPLETMLTCPEPTFEGLTHLLDMGQPSIGIFSSEGGQFFGGHGMSEDNRLRSIGGYSNLWDGDNIRRVRRGDGSKTLYGRRLSIHLMIQPDIAKPYLADDLLRQQGFLSRFLISAPASTMGGRFFQEVSKDCRRALELYGEHMLKIMRYPLPLAEGQRNELSPRLMPLAGDAKPLWTAFHDECEAKLASGGEYADVRAFANKLPEQALRLAGVLALTADVEARAVDAENMRRGIVLARYYAGEAVRLAEARLADANTIYAERARAWLLERWEHEVISIPDLQRSVPITYLRNSADRCKKVVALLTQHNWLVPSVEEAVINGKRRRETWRINRPQSQNRNLSQGGVIESVTLRSNLPNDFGSIRGEK